MNPIEDIQCRLIKDYPDIKAYYDKADIASGFHFLDIHFGKGAIYLEWKPSIKIGFSFIPNQSDSLEGMYSASDEYLDIEEAYKKICVLLKEV